MSDMNTYRIALTHNFSKYYLTYMKDGATLSPFSREHKDLLSDPTVWRVLHDIRYSGTDFYLQSYGNPTQFLSGTQKRQPFRMICNGEAALKRELATKGWALDTHLLWKFQTVIVKSDIHKL